MLFHNFYDFCQNPLLGLFSVQWSLLAHGSRVYFLRGGVWCDSVKLKFHCWLLIAHVLTCLWKLWKEENNDGQFTWLDRLIKDWLVLNLCSLLDSVLTSSMLSYRQTLWAIVLKFGPHVKKKCPVHVHWIPASSDAVFPSVHEWQIATSNSRRRRVQMFCSVISKSNIFGLRHRSEFSFGACVQLGVGDLPLKFHQM